MWTDRIALFLISILLAGCTSGMDKEERGEQISDVDGNLYKTVQIGNQVWMAEDLKTTHFKEGTSILLVEDYEEWANLKLPAYCWYNNDSLVSENFGALYNGYVLDEEKLCPEGWHIPTEQDWIELEAAVGDSRNAGGALKEEGTEYWKAPNTGATNQSGFSARPGGYRSYTGTFNLKRTFGYWWSSTEKSWFGSSPRPMFMGLQYKDRTMYREIAEKANGFSVRCVKDQESD